MTRKKGFAPIINNKSKILILGTFPGLESLRLKQYYGHRYNSFWKLLSRVYEQEINDREDFILRNNLALWDTVESCEREGSLDSSIKKAKFNDFSSLFNRYPNIKKVLVDSKSALKYWKRIIKEQGINMDYDYLPSPSSAHAKMSFEKKLNIWKSKLI